MDKDGDGHLQRVEIIAVLEKYGKRDIDEIEDIIDKLDTEG